MARHTNAWQMKEVREHLRELGLPNSNAYFNWCQEHRFKPRLEKSDRERHRELTLARELRIEASLATKANRHPIAYFEKGFTEARGQSFLEPRAAIYHWAWKQVQHNKRHVEAFKDLVDHVAHWSDLLEDVTVEGNNHATIVGGLLALAAMKHAWVLPLRDWKPRSHNRDRQFHSLVSHLLVRWPVPAFFYQVWFKGGGNDARAWQRRFIHVAQGRNLRTCDLPLPYTKMMAHHFMQAPDSYTVEAALRWGQMRAMGASQRLIEEVLGSCVGTYFHENDFWSGVLQFLAQQTMLDMVQIGPLLDYLANMRFVGWPRLCEAREPRFSIKGRTVQSLLAQMHEWHRALRQGPQTTVPHLTWQPSGLRYMEVVEGGDVYTRVRWVFTELLTVHALRDEGRAMHHCVATYAGTCAAGQSAIFALERHSIQGMKKIMTIEVRLGSMEVVQARGKCNERPEGKALDILSRWARSLQLGMSEYL